MYTAAFSKPLVRYGLAAVAVPAAFFLRHGIVHYLGVDLPPFITFYPAIMLAAVLGGLWPGLLATVLSALAADYLIMPPFGFGIARPSDVVALAFFAAMGVFMSVVAGRYRHSERLIAAEKQKQALRWSEEKLRQASEYSQLALDAAGLGTWEFLPETRDVSVDDNCRKLFGFQPDEVDASGILATRIHPDDRGRVDEAIKRSIAGANDGLWGMEYRVVWPDGSIHWLTSHGRTYFNGNGQSNSNGNGNGHGGPRLIGVNMDITGRKLAEEARAADRAKLDAAMASMTDAVFISDADGRFVQFNEAFATFHRFRNKAECAKSLSEYPDFLDVSLSEGTPAPLEMWAVPRALRGETATNVEYGLRRKDTGESWVGSYSFSPICDQAGAIIGSVAVGRDITEQKAAEQKLRDSEASLAVAQARAHLGSWEADLATWEAKWSAEMSRLYYRDPSSAAPTFEDFLEMVHPEDRGLLANQRDHISDFDTPFEFECRTNPAIGPMRYLNNTFYVIRNAAGSPVRLGGTSQDITERRRAEEELRKREELFHGLFSSMDEGFCIIEMIFDPTGKPVDYRFLEINAAFEGQTGLHNAVGKRMLEFAPNHEQHWFETYGKIALTGEPAHLVSEAKALDRHFDVRAYRVGEPELRRVAVVFSDITARARAAEEVRESERQFHGLADAIPQLCWMANADGWIYWYNQGWYEYTGTTSEQMEGWGWKSVHDPDTLAAVLNEWTSSIATGRPFEMIFPLRGADGAFRPFLTRVNPVKGADGAVVKWFGTNTDISAQQLAQKQIQRLNRVYAVLSDINQMIVREKDSQAMLEAACRIAVDRGAFRMAWIGMMDPATQVLKPIASSGLNDGYLDQVRIDLKDPSIGTGPAACCFRTGEHSICNDIEHELYRPWRDCALQHGYRSVAAFPLRGEGQMVGIFKLYASELGFFDDDETKLLDEMAMDISFALDVNRRAEERRRTEEELRWRTAFFEAQVDSSIDGVLIVDSHGNKILQNQRMNELLGIPQDLADDSDDSAQLEFVTKLMKNPEQFIEKVRYLMSHPDEVSRDEVELHDGRIYERFSSPVRDKSLNYYGRIWRFVDITERRQLEEQFRQAQKMEAVGQLTGGIAHDFNNLLTVIQGCSEVIGDESKDNARLSKMSAMISGAAQRGAELTHRMLAFARRQTLQPGPVNVNQLLADMQSFLRRTLSADIELDVLHGCEDCTAIVDPTQLESALLNLCVNARDAMTGGGHMTIESSNIVLDTDYAKQDPDITPGDYIQVAVSDTGCGISPENLKRVFEPFFTTKDVGKGSGLGLSMVYGFAKQSQGHVRIYSEAGRGTSVKLFLPKANAQGEIARQYTPPIGDHRGSEVILLVEDNDAVREFAKSQLENLGYSVLEAANGKEALTVMSEHAEIDLLFTDMVMPGGMNGRDLAQEACRLRPTLKILYCSGYAENAVVHQGLLNKGVHLLNKPYTRVELARRIRKVLAEG